MGLVMSLRLCVLQYRRLTFKPAWEERPKLALLSSAVQSWIFKRADVSPCPWVRAWVWCSTDSQTVDSLIWGWPRATLIYQPLYYPHHSNPQCYTVFHNYNLSPNIYHAHRFTNAYAHKHSQMWRLHHTVKPTGAHNEWSTWLWE